MRGCLVSLIGVLGVMAACSGGLLLWVAVDTADSGEKAEQFLDLLGDGKGVEAYAVTASAFQEEESEDLFVEFAVTVGQPLRYELRPWRDRTLERRGKVRFKGTLLEGYGIDIDFFLDLTQENGEWKVIAFTDIWRRDAGPGMWFKLVPGVAELTRLANGSVRAFAKAIANNDLKGFYENEMSSAFKQQTAFATFEIAYQHFFDKEIDISGVADVDPVFNEDLYNRLWGDAPNPSEYCPIEKLDELGRIIECSKPEVNPFLYPDRLEVAGFYPLEPKPVPFNLTYTYDHPNWAIFRIGVFEPTIAALSPEQCAKWLVRMRESNFELCASYEDPQN